MNEHEVNEDWGKYANAYDVLSSEPVESISISSDAEAPDAIEFLKGKHGRDKVVVRIEPNAAMPEDDPLSSYVLSDLSLREDQESQSKLGQKDKVVFASKGEDEFNKSIDDIFNMIDGSYSSIGGHFKISSPQDVANYPKAALTDIDTDPEADAVMLAKQNGKITAIATDGSSSARSKVKTEFGEFMGPGWSSELSGKAAAIAAKDDSVEIIDSEKGVRRSLGDKDIEWHGEHPEGLFPGVGGWYTRLIAGKPTTKILVKKRGQSVS